MTAVKIPTKITVVLFLSLASFASSDTTDAVKRENCNGGVQECSRKRLQLLLPRIDGVKVGYTQEVELQAGKKHTLKTLSLSPPVFEISNFFSDDECEYVIDMAQKRGMRESNVATDRTDIGNDTSKETFEAWDTDKDGYVDIEEFIYLPGKSDIYFTEEDVKEMFKKLSVDTDGDDKISYEEFTQVTVPAIKEYFKEIRKVRSSLRSRTSSYTWMWHDDDDLLEYEDVLEDYHQRFSKLTKLPEKIIEQSEPLQVVRYGENGHYHCHQDSEIVNRELPCCTYGNKNCRLCRYVTVMVYLNDVEEGGQSAFPLADNETFSWDAWARSSNVRCNLAKHCDKSNLVIKPEKGKAILWYNHKLDGSTGWMGVQDPLTFHGECPVTKGVKWMANMWINIVGDGTETLRAWKMGHNWLATNNRNQEIIDSFEHTFIEIEQEPKENRFTEEKNRKVALKGHLDEAMIDIVEDQVVNEEPIKVQDEEPNGPEPIPPKYKAAPLPLPRENLLPKGPKEKPNFRPLPPPNVEGNRIVQSILILLEELDNPELEIVARILHDKLKLVCVPLIMNPMGSI